jgi:hypothetical protein
MRPIKKRPTGNKSGITCFMKQTIYDWTGLVGWVMECRMSFSVRFFVTFQLSIAPAYRYDASIADQKVGHFGE